MKLVFVESPGKIKKLESYLGPGWQVKPSVGHIRDLPSNDLGVDLASMTPKYVLTDTGKKVVGGLRQIVASASEVYLATDLDREGEAIAWHLQQVFNLPIECKRIVFNEITKSAITNAINNPRLIDLDMVYAQESRRILDRLVGYTVSPELNKILPKTSAGRVQSIALRLVVERQQLIDSHKSAHYFHIDAFFDGYKATFTGDYNRPQDYTETTKPYRLQDKGQMTRLTAALGQNPELKVAKVDQKRRKKSPPPPFTTSVLQQAASVALKMSPDVTMKVAQKLYEQGLITYMRTDSVFLSSDAIRNIRQWIEKFQEKKGVDWLLPSEPNNYKSSGDAQEAHEAIRPSDVFDVNPALEGQEKSLYQLIWKRTVASQCSHADIDQLKLLMISRLKINEAPVTFEAKGETIITPGWLIISGDDKSDETEKEDNQKLPILNKGDILKPMQYRLDEKSTKPAKRYTEASLIKALEDKGVGRPSTYASIMKTIMARKYVKLEGRLLEPTQLGVNLFEVINKADFSFFDYEYTQGVESKLDQIAKNVLNSKDFLRQEFATLTGELASLTSAINKKIGTGLNCKCCSNEIIKKKGSWGDYYACASCNQIHDANGILVEKKLKVTLDLCCNVCSTPIVKLNTAQDKPAYFKCEKCDYLIGSDAKGEIDVSSLPRISDQVCVEHNVSLIIRFKRGGDEYTTCPKCTKKSKAKMSSKGNAKRI